MSEWLPIEKAPTGLEVLVTGPLCNDIKRGRYIAVAMFRDGYWYESEDSSPNETLYDPTHWMPLPDLPKP